MSGRSALARSFARSRAPLAALGAIGLLGGSGCGDEPPASVTPAARPDAEAKAPAAAGAPLRFAGGRVTVAREEVLQLALLEELAASAGFELEVGDVAPRSLTLRLTDAPLLEAVSAILEGTAFRASWAVDPASGEHVLAKLSVGAVATPPAAAAGAAPPPDAAAERARSSFAARMRERVAQRRESAEEPARDAAAALEQRRAREAVLIAQLDEGDALRRAEALEVIDPTGDAAGRIGELARSDPDPHVRAVAVERLGDADTYQAKTVLLESLADPAPQVVIAALAAIEFSGDASLLPRIEPFANHPDPSVREAANEAIEGLQ